MKKLFFFLFLISLFSKSFAQFDTINLEKIVITSNRVPMVYSESARVVAIISRNEIQNAPIQNLNDLLKFALNVDIRQRGGEGMQADVSIRGGNFEQTLILINGIKMNDPQTGHHNLNLPIDVENISRIEILEGPAARVFGANAFCGAINIITESENKNSVRCTLSAGDFGLLNTSLSTTLHTKNTEHLISTSYKRCDGYIENTDFKNFSIFYQNKISFTKNTNISLQTGWLDKKFGANSFYSPKYPNQFEQTRTFLASVNAKTGNIIPVSVNFYCRKHFDRFELFRENPPSWYKNHNFHQTDIFGTDMNAYYRSFLGKTALGFELRNEEILSNVLGEKMNETVEVPFEKGIFFTKNKKREILGFFAEHSITFHKFSLSAGLMQAHNSDFGWKTYWGTDFAYQISRNFKVFASINQALRIPTFTELYYFSKTELANPNLKPEEAKMYETGVKFQSQYFYSHLAVFQRDSKNSIDWVKTDNFDTLWESANLTEISTQGIELQTIFYPKKFLQNSFPVEFVQINYSFLQAEKESGQFISRYVMDFLKHKFSFNVNALIYKGLGASLCLSYQKREGTYSAFDKEKKVSLGEKSYPDVTLIDGRIFWREKYFEIFAESSNLLNESYFDIGNIEMPKMWFRGGVKVFFNWEK